MSETIELSNVHGVVHKTGKPQSKMLNEDNPNSVDP